MFVQDHSGLGSYEMPWNILLGGLLGVEKYKSLDEWEYFWHGSLWLPMLLDYVFFEIDLHGD